MALKTNQHVTQNYSSTYGFLSRHTALCSEYSTPIFQEVHFLLTTGANAFLAPPDSICVILSFNNSLFSRKKDRASRSPLSYRIRTQKVLVLNYRNGKMHLKLLSCKLGIQNRNSERIVALARTATTDQIKKGFQSPNYCMRDFVLY